MEDNKKIVMILEKTGTSMQLKEKDEKGYVLEGIFAQFGILNNNKRIYEEKEYLPHLEYLKDKINKKMLFGELDHPKEFDVSLKNVSHVIESLEYDKENRQIRGKIRLVNTDAGRNAKALVDAGLQMSISSRAAGIVKEDNKVEIKRIFTYDLVAEPGFPNAQLTKINENFGFSDDDENIAIYDMSSIYENNFDLFDNESLNEKNKKNMNDTTNTPVTVEMMNKYTQHIKEQYDSLKEELLSYKKNNNTSDIDLSLFESKIADIDEYLKYFSDNYDKLLEYNDVMVNNYNSNIKNIENYFDHIYENNTNIEEYLDYAGESIKNIEDYLDHIHENNTNIEEYLDYQSEKVKENINTTQLLIKYNNYLAENIKNLINYTESLAENVNILYKHNNYLTENINNLIEYTEYIKDSINESNSNNENKTNNVSEGLNVLNESYNNYDENKNLISKIDTLIESVKKQKADDLARKENFPYFKLLSESKQKEFLLLPNNQKQKIINEIIKSKPMNESDFISIWQEVVNPIDESKQIDYIISLMPDNYKPIWEKLDESSKNRILSQSKYYNLQTPYQINSFWQTRKVLNEAVEFQKLNENQEYSEKINKVYGNSYMNSIAMGLKRLK